MTIIQQQFFIFLFTLISLNILSIIFILCVELSNVIVVFLFMDIIAVMQIFT